MAIPTVKLVADVPVEIKEKAQRIANEKGVSIKQLIVELIKNIPEEKKGKTKKKK